MAKPFAKTRRSDFAISARTPLFPRAPAGSPLSQFLVSQPLHSCLHLSHVFLSQVVNVVGSKGIEPPCSPLEHFMTSFTPPVASLLFWLLFIFLRFFVDSYPRFILVLLLLLLPPLSSFFHSLLNFIYPFIIFIIIVICCG